MHILFFGDSTTHGLWGKDGGWVQRLRKHYDVLAPQDLQHDQQPTIYNLGILGETTRSLLVRLKAETIARSWPGEQQVAVIAIGTNDGLFEAGEQWVSPQEFERNLESIVEVLKPITDGIVLVGNPACDETRTMPVSWGDYTYTNQEIERSEATIAMIASKHNLPYVPLFAAFKAKLDSGADLLTDGLHPNDAGHQLIADLVGPTLDKLCDAKETAAKS